MNIVALFNEFKAVIPDLSKEWKDKYSMFLTDENLLLFSENLVTFYNQKTEISRLPYFNDEIIISLQDSIFYFSKVLEALEKDLSLLKSTIIEALEETPFEIILLILGQRLTSASRRDETGIPPRKEILLESCFLPFNTEISIAARAWEKHVGRKKDSIFGTIKGNSSQKQQAVEKLINYIINHKTWWNVFYHYKHDLVYEIRVENGQGMRWSSDGKRFIGFLEDFLEE
ncbi:hypothetical protein [Flavobacterium hydatis]|uniref:Uncharacterized protein n=1 Tax=Flavobacterium hydatis TaxID=991 RepID=A0ABX4C4W1_FLAHY|nr:hypothetical protein [Flavobacterium hydatis]OXA87752.1 hypothetical protein B0A62_22370 [Flavobacterium hydatis]